MGTSQARLGASFSPRRRQEGDWESLAGGQKLRQLANERQLGGHDQAHGQEGVPAAGHGVLLVGHPLQRGRGGRGVLLARAGRGGKKLGAAALGYELDVAAAHGAHPGTVGPAQHAGALVAGHGAPGGKQARQRGGAAALELGRQRLEEALVTDGSGNVVHA